MTPKEKAAELIDKFTYLNTSEAEREGIKSALSCVDEILDASLYSYDEMSIYVIYWQKVKQEIQKL